MKKKQSILVALIVMAVLTAGAWRLSQPENSLVVHGELLPKEIGDIKRAVKKEMYREFLAGLSWSNLKTVPGRAKWYFGQDVRAITVYRPNYVSVDIGSSRTRDLFAGPGYNVSKGTNGWTAQRQFLCIY